MKQENKKRNKWIACAMCVVMLGATLFGTPWFSVQADDTTTSTTGGQSYGAWSEQLVTNGSFEAGYDGKEVYGWHKTAMQQGHGISTDSNYLNAYTLKTVKEADGNKVAALTKDGAGYIAATSEEIGVTANTEYSISFDYKILNMSLPEGATISNFNGVRLYVVELDANGNVVTNKGISAATMYYKDVTYVFDTLRSGMGVFTTSSTTEKVVIYLYTGATNANISFTIHFDNVVLEETPADYEVLNGTFDYLTHKADGGRIVAESEGSAMGPAGWGMYNAVGNHYKVTTVDDINKGNVACMTFADNDTAGGNSSWLSPFIPVQGQKDLTVAFDYNLIMEKVANSTQTVDPSVTVRIFQYNSSKSFKGVDNSSGAITTATTDWTKAVRTVAGTVLDSSTAYIRIAFYVSFTAAEVTALEEFGLYLDNVVLDVGDETDGYKSLGYTKYSATNYGRISSTAYAQNYAIQKVNAGAGREDAVQLYVVNADGCNGGAIFYSEPKTVTASTEYVMKFEFKIEGVEDSSNNYGADITLRYRTSDGTLCTEKTSGTGGENRWNSGTTSTPTNLENTTSWTEHSIGFTTPSDCAYVEIGLLIGGTPSSNVNGELKNSFAKMRIAPKGDSYWTTTDVERYNTDLIFKLTEKGNAFIDDTSIDVLDLVMMKKYAEDATLITGDILKNADMNVNTLINNADIELLHWKLLGVTTEDQASQVHGYEFE